MTQKKLDYLIGLIDNQSFLSGKGSMLRFFGFLLLISMVSSCTQNKEYARVERESAERSRLEALSNYTHEDGTLRADVKNGSLVYENYCQRCHGKNGKKAILKQSGFKSLAQSSIVSPDSFFHALNYGIPHTSMKPFINQLPIPDLIDVTAYVQTLEN